MSECGRECSGPEGCLCEPSDQDGSWDVGLTPEDQLDPPEMVNEKMKPFICAVVEGAVVEGVVNGLRVGTMHLILASLENGGFTAIEIILSREEMLEWSDLLKATGSSVPPLQQQIERKQALAVAVASNGKESPLG